MMRGHAYEQSFDRVLRDLKRAFTQNPLYRELIGVLKRWCASSWRMGRSPGRRSKPPPKPSRSPSVR